MRQVRRERDPELLRQRPLDAGRGEEGSATHDPGAEDFSGFRNYTPGDPLRHVAWKTLAKGQPLQTREYVAFADRRVWLTWAQTADWGALLATGDTLDIRIDQLSALVGRGAPKTVALTF